MCIIMITMVYLIKMNMNIYIWAGVEGKHIP